MVTKTARRGLAGCRNWKLSTFPAKLNTYLEWNQTLIPNRNGERIASGFVESAVNQVVSKRMQQQMGWTQRHAHLSLQIRTRVLNEEWENTFRS